MSDEDEYLKETVEKGVFSLWQEVDIEVYSFSELGMTVAINNDYVGLVYASEIYDDYYEGQELKGYIKLIREDGKIDVSLRPQGTKHVKSVTDTILEHLESVGGRSHLNDKSSPEAIKGTLKISKKVFKQAIGRLYKLNKIEITDKGIALVKKQ